MLGWFSYFNRDPVNIRNRTEYGGGALMDVGCYLINTSRFIFDREPARAIGAMQRDPEMGTDRLTSILLDFEVGHSTGTCSTQMVPAQRMQILGTKGRIELDDPVQRATRSSLPHRRRHWRRRVRRRHLVHQRRHLQSVHDPGRSVVEGDPGRHGRAAAARRCRRQHGVHRRDRQIDHNRLLGGRAVTVSIYLGLDSSTQSVTATAIEVDGDRRTILFERTFRYDDELPQYGTKHGVLRVARSEGCPCATADVVRRTRSDDRDARARHQRRLEHASRDLRIGAAARQRLRQRAMRRQRLEQLAPSTPLAAQLEGVFSRKTSPIWMDSSTTPQCAAIEAAVGGPRRLAQITGSRAFERFTGPQIRKFAEQDPAGYAATDRVHLVSSWLASLLAGTHAPIDPGDGSGMNLMELASRQWSADAVQATAPNLAAKLPPVAEAWTIAGTLAPYWTRTYGLPPARVVAWSGDNPCSLVGTGLVREGLVAISLGTSDTIFGIMPTPRPSDDGTGHVFASPTGAYMGMTVFKNGSLARERVRDVVRMDWPAFSKALAQTPAGNSGKTLLPWFDPEITPLVLTPGVRRYGLEPADSEANVRAIVEAQMMALALHSRWMGVRIGTIYATGGASANRDVLQVMANVFDAEVFQLQTGNSAALGAALRAFHADRLADGDAISWDDVVKGFVAPKVDSRLSPHSRATSTSIDA